MMTLAGATVELEINFSNGWNWFSVNAIQDDMGINSAFSGLPAQANDYIKSQTSSATYYAGYGWYPGFDVSVTSMYLLNLVNSGTMIYEGVPADPAQTPISLSPGWNWIGYVPQASMSVTSALANSPVDANDYIKSQTTSATYYGGYGFYPGFDMSPTAGYMLQVANGGDLVYPSGSLALSIPSNGQNENLFYKEYEYNGSVSVSVDIDNVNIDEDDILYAYSNNELRGIATPSIFPLTGEMVFTIMVYSNEIDNDRLHFELYNNETDTTYPIKETLVFEKDMIVGNAYNTFELSEETYTPQEFKLLPAYPNPFNPATNISYSIPESQLVELSVYDIMGRLVKTLVDNQFKVAGNQSGYKAMWYGLDNKGHQVAAGVYIYRLQSGSMSQTNKMILLK